jgi:predicted small lipoprotein YifL
MKRLMLYLLAAAVPLVMTAACGQKGPLYLPPKNGTVVTRPAANQPPAPNTTATPAAQPGAAPSSPPDKKNNQDDSQTPPR